MEFREVNNSDIYDLYLFRNDVLSRKMSINKDQFSFEMHKDWFLKQLANKLVDIYIYEDVNSEQKSIAKSDASNKTSLIQEKIDQIDSCIIASIRREKFDAKINNFEVWQISYIVNPKLRQLGYGSKMIKEFMKFKPGKYCAEVLKNNIPSIKTLKKNGFILNETTEETYLFYNFKN